MTTPPARPARRRTDKWQIAALVLAVLASLLLLVLPAYSSATQSSDGAEVTSTRTLLEVEGASVLIPLAVPALLMLLPLYPSGPSRRWISLACTILLAAFALLALLSIGAFYLPALVCSIAATTAAMTDPRPSS